MTTGMIFLMYAGMAIVTYGARRAFLRLPAHLFSKRLKNGMTFIPVGIFAALIFPSIFIQEGSLKLDPLLLGGAAVCLGLMALTRNVFVSFGVSLFIVVLVKTGVLGF
jgi:branched-subunit amino acid transport protein